MRGTRYGARGKEHPDRAVCGRGHFKPEQFRSEDSNALKLLPRAC